MSNSKKKGIWDKLAEQFKPKHARSGTVKGERSVRRAGPNRTKFNDSQSKFISERINFGGRYRK